MQRERLARGAAHPEDRGERGQATRVPLVLVVDIDNDVGDVVGVDFIRGYEEVLEAAVSYALARPEDSDVNAMFAGLKLYRTLKSERGDAEIAVVGGDRFRSLEAQRKIKERVKMLVDDIGDAELYIVSDGEDEIVISQVLADIAPIAGIKRVVVEQHLGIESSYLLVVRYIKKALAEPRFAKYTLGIPGLILTVGALLSIAGLIDLALRVAAVILGIALMVYGFGLEGFIANVVSRIVRELSDIPHIKLAGLAMALVTMAIGVGLAYESYSMGGPLVTTAYVLKYSIPLALLGASIYVLVSGIIASAARGKVDVSRQAALIVMLGFSALAFYSLGSTMASEIAAGTTDLALAVLYALIDSKFIHYMLVGAGLAGLVELLSRAIK